MIQKSISIKSFLRYVVVMRLIFESLLNNRDVSIRRRFYLAQILVVLTILLNIVAPILYGHTVDILKISQPIHVVLFVLVAYGLTWILSQILVQIRGMIAFKVVRRLIRELNLKVFCHLHKLSLRYHLDRNTGSTTTIIDRIEYSLNTMFWHFLFYLIPILAEIIIIQIILIFCFKWHYSLILTAGVFSFVSFTYYCTLWDTNNLQLANEASNIKGGKAVDSLLNFETVKQFNNEYLEAERYDEVLFTHEKANIKSDITFESVNLGQNLIVGITLTILTVVSGLHVMKGSLTIGDFVTLNAYLMRIIMPLSYLGYVIRELKNSVTNFDDIISILNEPIEIQDAYGAKALQFKKGLIEFKNIKFSYSPEKNIINNFSLTIPPGKSVAIVGKSGSGKSTISRLLLRFFDVDNGEILIDGQNITNVTQSSLRELIAIVPQDTMLFNDTIYNNISYGRPSAKQEEIVEAAKTAHIHDTIMKLSDGYNTIVGERGIKLSGGEKQRIAIARAVLKKPKIYVFDEATSSLDGVIEREIQSNLLEISQNTSTLIIAHRLSTVTHCDEIVVLENGQIIERGSHESLLKHGNIYSKMWNIQTKNKL